MGAACKDLALDFNFLQMMEASRKIMKLYASMESMEASLGGGGGFEGFYGSVTANGVSRVYESMAEHCGFGNTSFLVDIGGGVGRPLVHALVQPGVKKAVGLELDEIKCLKSESVIRESFTLARELASEEGCIEPRVIHRDVEKVNAAGTLDPATHAYAFWEGIPVKARTAFGELFARSSTLKSVAIVQRAIRKKDPADLMADYNFGSLELVDTLKGIHMSGSNRSFTAYVFKRLDPPGTPYEGSEDALLSNLLTAPRLLQASLPRLLRRRNAKPSYAEVADEPVPVVNSKARPRGRVALADTMPHLCSSSQKAGPKDANGTTEAAAECVSQINSRPAIQASGGQDPPKITTATLCTGKQERPECTHIPSTGPVEQDAAQQRTANRHRRHVEQRKGCGRHKKIHSAEDGICDTTRRPCAERSNKSQLEAHGDDDVPYGSSRSAEADNVGETGKSTEKHVSDHEFGVSIKPAERDENCTPGTCPRSRRARPGRNAVTQKGLAGGDVPKTQLSPGKRDPDIHPLPTSPSKRSCA